MTTKISLTNIDQAAQEMLTASVMPKIIGVAYPGTATAVTPAGGETITLTGTGFAAGVSVVVGSTTASSVTLTNSTQLSFTAPAKTAGTYNIYVINTDGGTATSVPGLSYSGTPAWTTTAGSLGSVIGGTSGSFTVAATSDSTVTYSVTSGSLPTGLSLNSSTGAITGTADSVGSDTTSSFTIRATDAESQTTDRSFTVTVTAPLTIDYLVVAGGGGGSQPGFGGWLGGGGGAGGFRTGSGVAVILGSAYAVTIGSGGAGGGNKSYGGSDPVQGNDSSLIGTGISTISAGGGRAGGTTAGAAGGSGGGGSTPGGYGGAGNTPSTTPSQGNNGSPNGTGGGGAGAAGSSYTGGAGREWPTGSGTYYAGGGGGAAPGPVYFAAGGIGGGGSGGDGTANTGGGGGGRANDTGGNGGAGGSGVVIIRYSDTKPAASATTGSPTVTVAGGYRTYKFTASGTITF